MYGKIIKNDIKKSKLITVTITVFILLAALFTSLGAEMIINLLGSIDNFMLEAKTPHFMQMHSGKIDMERLENFARTQKDVETFQVSKFLNIEGAEILIGENTLAGSVQDNGLSVQSDKFDFLLDSDGNRIYPDDGEIYIPVYYMKEGIAKQGDSVTIYGVTFKVAGFLRDSQMNPAMISSKRFLVSDADYEKLQDFGKLEYLITFRLTDSASVGAFESAYLQAGLEANGPPAITYQLFKLANGMTDGMMIAVLVLISLLVIVVTFLCIRFTLIAKIEEDYREIGVLKAVGLRVSYIKKLYLAKYGAISAIACVFGFLISLLLQEPLMENIRLYMGDSNRYFLGVVVGAIGAAIIFFVIILYVNGVLSRFRKISAAQAIRFGAPQDRDRSSRRFSLRNHHYSPNIFLGINDVLSRKKLYVTMLLVLVISSFLMVVPQNIYHTISSKNFVTYMGIGNYDMRLDIQQTDNIPEKAAEISHAMAQDDSISRYTVLTSMMFDIRLDNGETGRFKVELGDHSVFPIAYSSGRAPQSETEIAVSALNADDLGKTVGDEVVLVIDGVDKRLTICGIYSDITNGGKTAKAIFHSQQKAILWSIIPVEFHDSAITDLKVLQYKEQFPFARVADIDEYLQQSFGSTKNAIQQASRAAISVACLLSILVTVLFIKMLITKDRYSIAVLKSVGFSVTDIRKQYIIRSIIVLVLGVIIGILLSNTLGELVGVALISTFGASTFHFEVAPVFAYVLSPLVIASCVFIATLLGTSDIRTLKIADYIKE
jgi:putative ABC transport system permease protein